jgi:hypothetical protein
MKEKLFFPFLIFVFLAIQGCAGGVVPIMEQKAAIPMQKANAQLIFQENEGLVIVWEDAKDARDFYRGGVQEKAKGEKHFREKAYPEAMKSFQASNDFLTKMLHFMDEDCAEFTLYEGTDILFFPNLLMADNYLKMGLIQRETGHESSAQGSWKRAQSSVQKSLQSEKTEWGLSLEKEVSGLLGTKKN